jgi:sn-glycerol 3-phosphate transport system substrate-binding protein
MKRNVARNATGRAVGLAAAAALLLLSGCAGLSTRTEVRFWHAMDGQLGESVDELVRKFNESQREFEVKAVYKGTYPEVFAETMAAYRQRNAPNIVQIYEVGTQSMLSSDAIVPVHRLMKQQGIAVDWDDFIAAVTGYYTKDGKLYSMPFNASTPILYYNKDIFRKAGLDDAPPATWPEVEAASRKILAAGAAQCGFTTSWPSWTILENTFAWHVQPFATNENGHSRLDTQLLFNGGFGRMHVGAFAKWQREGVFAYEGRFAQPDSKFVDGECAMLMQSSAVIGDFKRTLKFHWGTGQIPHWGPPYPKGNTTLGGATLWVMRGHRTVEDKGVAQFLAFLAATPQQKWWATTTGYVPITKSAVESLEADGYYKRDPEEWTAVSQLLNASTATAVRGPRLGNYVQVRAVVELQLARIFSGKVTVQQGLDAAVTRGNAILRQFAVTHGAAGQGEI